MRFIPTALTATFVVLALHYALVAVGILGPLTFPLFSAATTISLAYFNAAVGWLCVALYRAGAA